MNTQTLKITMNKLFVKDNGESPGQGEIYWSLLADDQVIESLDRPGRKVGDNETIILGRSGTVTKSASVTLTILGNVSEKDGFLKGDDDTDSFRQVYTAANNWGIGSHTVKLGDGKHLDVTLYYTIAKA